MSRLLQRLHGRVSSHRARFFLHAAQAAPALLPEAIRLAVRMALLKDLLSFRAAIGTVESVFKAGCIWTDNKAKERLVFIAAGHKG